MPDQPITISACRLQIDGVTLGNCDKVTIKPERKVFEIEEMGEENSSWQIPGSLSYSVNIEKLFISDTYWDKMYLGTGYTSSVVVSLVCVNASGTTTYTFTGIISGMEMILESKEPMKENITLKATALTIVTE